MDERAVKRQLSIKTKLIGPLIPLILVTFIIVDSSLGLGLVPRLVTRFCYNSPNPTQVNLLGCTGSSALNVNITAAQAFCVISNCLGQVRQSPVFLGRKKRSDDSIESLNDEIDGHSKDDNNLISVNDIKEKEIIDQKSTQSVYKYNPNDHFIVAKEVEALIIDLPESIDDAVFSV